MKKSERDLIWYCRSTLLRCAAKARRRNPKCPLSAESIVQEAWVRLRVHPVAQDVSESHYKAIAGRVMHYVVYDAAQRRRLERDAFHTELAADHGSIAYSMEAMLALTEALKRLEARDERRYRIAVETWFGGCTAKEVAAALDTTEAVVRHELDFLRSWRNGLLAEPQAAGGRRRASKR